MKSETFAKKMEKGIESYMRYHSMIIAPPLPDQISHYRYGASRAANGNKALDEMYYEEMQAVDPEKYKRMQAIIQHSIEVQRRQMQGKFYWYKVPPFNPMASLGYWRQSALTVNKY